MDASWEVGAAGSTTGPCLICYFYWTEEERGRRNSDQLMRKGEWGLGGRGEVRVPIKTGKGHRLRQRDATLKTMTGSHTKPSESLLFLPTTGLHWAKKMTKINTGCVCVGEISVEPHLLSCSALFSFFPSSTSPISPFFSLPPSHHPSCLYFLTVHAVLHMPSARVRGQLS